MRSKWLPLANLCPGANLPFWLLPFDAMDDASLMGLIAFLGIERRGRTASARALGNRPGNDR